MVDRAYVPLSKETPRNEIDFNPKIPPYDDVGISFKGYSKTLLQGSEYKLNVQDRHIIQLNGTIATGSLSSTIPSEKIFFFYMGTQKI